MLAAFALAEREMISKNVDRVIPPPNPIPLIPLKSWCRIVLGTVGVLPSSVGKDVQPLETSTPESPRNNACSWPICIPCSKGPQVVGLSSLLQAGLSSGKPVPPPPGFLNVPSASLGGMMPPPGHQEVQVPQASPLVSLALAMEEPELSLVDKQESSDLGPEAKRRRLITSLIVLASQLQRNCPADFEEAARLFHGGDSSVKKRSSHRSGPHSGVKELGLSLPDLSDRGDCSSVCSVSLYTYHSDHSQCDLDCADGLPNGGLDTDQWARREVTIVPNCTVVKCQSDRAPGP